MPDVDRSRRPVEREPHAALASSAAAAQHAPPAVASQIRRLQATAGNHAVAQLMRVSAAARAKLAEDEGLPTVAAIQEFQDAGELSDEFIDLLLRLEPGEVADVIARDASEFAGGMETTEDILEHVAYLDREAEDAAEVAAAAEAALRTTVLERLEAAGVLTVSAEAFIVKEGVQPIANWIAGRPDAAIERAATLCTQQAGPTLARIDELLAYNVGHQNFPELRVLRWACDGSVARVREALEETVHEVRESYVSAWLSLGARRASPPRYKDLCRFKGRLAAGVGALTVYQADVAYAGSHVAGGRTGFLRHFWAGAAGPCIVFHTHWVRDQHIINSIHVSDGVGNSTELNTWPAAFFGDVNAEILRAHNASVRYPPTGGALRLA